MNAVKVVLDEAYSYLYNNHNWIYRYFAAIERKECAGRKNRDIEIEIDEENNVGITLAMSNDHLKFVAWKIWHRLLLRKLESSFRYLERCQNSELNVHNFQYLYITKAEQWFQNVLVYFHRSTDPMDITFHRVKLD